MARRRIDNWQLRKCAKACEQCESLFKDKQSLYSLLFFDNNEYVRRDVCDSCAKKEKHALSRWRTRFVLPAPSIHQIEKKEDVESLLRKLLALEDDSNLNAIFILTVMLERQKRLKERAVQKTPEGKKLRVYEHKKTGETLMIIDPDLKLDELEQVQEEVVMLLGGAPRSPAGD